MANAFYWCDKFGVMQAVTAVDGTPWAAEIQINVSGTDQPITGLAWDPVGNVLYGVSRTTGTNAKKLFSIDPATGDATIIGNLGTANSMTDITCSSGGQLYGWLAGGGGLHSINKLTGAATPIGTENIFSGGLAFVGSTLYYIEQSNGNPIYTVNTSTGVATSTGVTRSGNPFGVEGMEYHNGVLYAGGANSYYSSINLATGNGPDFIQINTSDVQAFVSIPIPPGQSGPPSAPANDDYANAVTLTTSPVSGTTLGATEDDPPVATALGPNVWYKITPAVDGVITFDNGFDLYTGATLGTASYVGTSNTFSLTAGTTYHIQWSVPFYQTADFTFTWTFDPAFGGTIFATSSVSGAVYNPHKRLAPTTGIAATSVVSGAIQRKRITPTTGIAATSTVAGRIVRRAILGSGTIAATSSMDTFLQDIIVYVPPEIQEVPAGPGYPLLGPAVANEDGYYIDSLSHGFDVFQTYRPENLRFKQIVREVQDADWEISYSQVNKKGDPIVYRRVVDDVDFVFPWAQGFQIRYVEDGNEQLVMAGFIKTTNGAKGRDYMKIGGVDWLAYLDHRMIPFNPHEPEATYADANFFGPSTPPTGFSYQVAARDIWHIVHDILAFIQSKPRSFPFNLSDIDTETMGKTINYQLSLGDTSTALSLISGLSEYFPGFDFMVGYHRNFVAWTPARYGDPDDTANSGPDGDNIAYAFGDLYDHPVKDIEFTNNGVQATHLLGTGSGTAANRLAATTGAGDIQRQFWRLDDSVDFGDQVKTQDFLNMLTRREFIFRAREVHEIELTIDPQTVPNFHDVIKPGYAIWLRDDLQFHEINSAQKVVSIEMTVDNAGNRTAVLGLNQIYDTSNNYGVPEAQMPVQRDPDRSDDILQPIYRRIAEMQKQIDRLSNQSTPTSPSYDSTGFPQDSIEGQTAVGVNDNNFWFYVNGEWRTVAVGFTWHDLTVESPWDNVGDPWHPVQYTSDGGGLRFRGAAQGGTSGVTLGHLPSDFWPTKDEQYVISSGLTPCVLDVAASDGAVVPIF